MKVPIFCVIGPHHCGKSTISTLLAEACKFALIDIKKILQNETNPITDKLVLLVLKKCLVDEETERGYIIDGFPENLRQAMKFENEVCKINVIIYVNLVLDLLLSRLIQNSKSVDMEQIRITYIRSNKRANAIFKKYEHKAVKVWADYPAKKTCNRLIETLEELWGYKFDRFAIPSRCRGD